MSLALIIIFAVILISSMVGIYAGRNLEMNLENWTVALLILSGNDPFLGINAGFVGLLINAAVAVIISLIYSGPKIIGEKKNA